MITHFDQTIHKAFTHLTICGVLSFLSTWAISPYRMARVCCYRRPYDSFYISWSDRGNYLNSSSSSSPQNTWQKYAISSGKKALQEFKCKQCRIGRKSLREKKINSFYDSINCIFRRKRPHFCRVAWLLHQKKYIHSFIRQKQCDFCFGLSIYLSLFVSFFQKKKFIPMLVLKLNLVHFAVKWSSHSEWVWNGKIWHNFFFLLYILFSSSNHI